MACAKIYYNHHVTIIISDALTINVSRSINGTYRVVRMTIIAEVTTWSVILMTLELSFTIVICLYYRPLKGNNAQYSGLLIKTGCFVKKYSPRVKRS